MTKQTLVVAIDWRVWEGASTFSKSGLSGGPDGLRTSYLSGQERRRVVDDVRVGHDVVVRRVRDDRQLVG